jgi:serine/threonine-protein kinase HipA
VNRCPITYDPIPSGQEYSARGLRVLHSRLTHLDPLPFTEAELIQEAANRAGKMSIQGIQPKLNAVVRVKEGRFELVDRLGRFILKPPTAAYPQLPENEALTMKLARLTGFELPDHGLVRAKDGRLVYWIRRFDRIGQGRRIAVEDFAQLCGENRETKYDSSVEKLAGVLNRYCTFPAVEKMVFFQRFLFNFLVGNEDMHLKNYSLITENEVVRLAPCYDFLNTTLILKNATEESALPLNGKKAGFTRNLLVQYLGLNRLELQPQVVESALQLFRRVVPIWKEWIEWSFLSEQSKARYWELVQARYARIGL